MTSPYNSRHWRKLRARYLAQHPLCKYCEEEGRITAATDVDHIIPHRGDLSRFYDPNNLQGLCIQHHHGAKQKAERAGKIVGCDASGNPIEQRDHWRGGEKV